MKDPIGDCLYSCIKDFSNLSFRENWAVLIRESSLPEAQKSAALMMPETSICTGRTWLFQNGSRFTISVFGSDPVQNISRIFACGGGKSFTTGELEELKKWRNH